VWGRRLSDGQRQEYTEHVTRHLLHMNFLNLTQICKCKVLQSGMQCCGRLGHNKCCARARVVGSVQ
jgi:hypothetical protein